MKELNVVEFDVVADGVAFVRFEKGPGWVVAPNDWPRRLRILRTTERVRIEERCVALYLIGGD